MKKITYIVAMLLTIIGALNWGLVGAFNLDLVSTLFGVMTPITRFVYVVVGLGGLLLLVWLKCTINWCNKMCSSSCSTESCNDNQSRK
jgi:uncharacterized membrane protein YuzA (DUF378 family)